MGLDNKFEMYIRDLCKRIKNKDVHAHIKLEINDHLHTLKEEAMSTGLSEEEAIDQALARMGDAGVLGKQLNKTHKAPMDVKTLLPVLTASLFGLLVMYYLQFHSAFTELQELKVFNKSLGFYLLGVVLMLSIFMFDYRRLMKYSKHFYAATILILLLTVLIGVRVDDVPFLNVGFATINFTEITPFLLVIAFAGIFHSWDWNDNRKSWFGIGMMSIPIILMATTGAFAATIISIIVCDAIMFTSRSSLKQTITFAVVASIWPIWKLLSLSQIYSMVSSYTDLKIGEAYFIGSALQVTPSFISEVHTDFILAYIIYSFGWLAAITAITLVIFFIYRISITAKSVNSPYGKLLITGLAAVFSAQFILSLLTNLGLSPLTGVSVPFMSYGGSHLLLEMISAGLILSVYRRRKTKETVFLTHGPQSN
ncbi:FtsW/RodA/SpoVE family cell cycle protein [Peribacillus frigoritolerans]|uniref:FtsW/RodA/SpoVE family cell cycle protein n=1 Tax=Peribacillus frigoritolerans TaxID=450367 RepID=UPI0010598249|nr:FtsW/RodA/SpoVE family cell cycle protein [Peribacillus frigoritolerans]TDL82791.1 FtsW/RodA/SpoVE family cell cycle protein [Peribacillus frigoritolerans]